jgi:hypothetical protein
MRQLAKNGLGIPESHTLCQVLNGQTEPRLDDSLGNSFPIKQESQMKPRCLCPGKKRAEMDIDLAAPSGSYRSSGIRIDGLVPAWLLGMERAGPFKQPQRAFRKYT